MIHRRFILQMEIEYDDGTIDQVISDDTWKYSTGALLHDGIFSGEVYDSRLEPAGWNKPGFDDSLWQRAKMVRVSFRETGSSTGAAR